MRDYLYFFIFLWTLLIICAIVLSGCRTVGEHWLKNTETGELELVEIIEMRGTAKHEIDFATKGGAKADSGFRVPDIDFDIDKLGN